MKIRSLIVGVALAGMTLTTGLQAQESSRILTNSDSAPTNEYEFLIKLVTTFGSNLSSRDAVTEVNDSPTLVTNNFTTYSRTTDSGTNNNDNLNARLVRNDERLGALNWLIKDNFNKDKLNLFDNKEWVDAGIPEYGFFLGFTEYFTKAALQTGDDVGRINLNKDVDEKTDGEFQF